MKGKFFSVLFALVLVLSLGLVMAAPAAAHPAPLTGVLCAPATGGQGATENHAITFTTPTGLANDEIVEITYPANFTLGVVAANAATWCGGVALGVVVNGQVITITGTGGGAVIAANASDTITLTNITNIAPANFNTSGAYTVSVRTLQSDGTTLIDGPTLSSPFGVWTTNFGATPACNPANLMVGAANVPYTVSWASTGGAIPAVGQWVPIGGHIVITFPAGFDISGAFITYGSTGFGAGVTFSYAAAGQTLTITTAVADQTAANASITFGIVTNPTVMANYNCVVTTTDASDVFLNGGASAGTFTLTPGALASYTVTTIGTQVAGAMFVVTATGYDAFGNVCTNDSTSVATFTSSSATLGFDANTDGTYTVTAGAAADRQVTLASGVANINTRDTVAATGITVTVTTGTVTATSNTFNINAAGAATYTVTSTSYTQMANVGFEVTARAFDTYGNPCTTGVHSGEVVNYTSTTSPGTVTFDVLQTDVTWAYPANESLVAGVSVIDAKDSALETGVTITATGATSGATGVTPAPGYTFSAGPADHFVVTTSGTGTETAGTAFSVTITAQDAANNTATGYTGAKTILFTSDATASPNGTLPTIPTSESITFTLGVGTSSVGFTLTNDGETPDITAGESGTTIQGTVTVTTVNTGTMTGFTVVTSGGVPGEVAGTAFSVTITAVDAYGNTDATYTGLRAVGFTSTATASPSATAATIPAGENILFAAGAGNSAAGGFTLTNAGERPTITASVAIGPYTGTSAAITVTAGAQSALAFTTATQTVTAGEASGAITVQVQDALGNPETSGVGTVNLATDSAQGTFSANAAPWVNVTTTTIVGASSVSFYYRDAIPGTPTITASATGLTSATQGETISALASYSVSLGTGWNLISFPIVPTNDSCSAMLTGTLPTNVTKVWTYNPDTSAYYRWTWATYTGTTWTGNLTTGIIGQPKMQPLWAYWMDMSAVDTLSVTGNFFKESGDLPSRSLSGDKWYFIGYHSLITQSVTAGFSSLYVPTATPPEKFDSLYTYTNGGWGKFDPAGVQPSDFTTLVPGKGYIIHMTAERTLTP